MVWKHVVQMESTDASGLRLWANGIRIVTMEQLLAVRRFRQLEESCYFGDALMARLGLRLLARLSRIAHFCLNVHFSSERRFIEIRIFSYTRGRARFLALVLVKLKSLLVRSDDIAYRAL